MKSIDLSKSMEGHVVLWAKNWYHDSYKEARSLDRLNEANNEWAGLTPDFKLSTRDILKLIVDTATKLEVNPVYHLDILLRLASQTNARLTSYHVGLQDQITLEQLIEAHTITINCARVMHVSLPHVLKGMRDKYDLKDGPF